jgi:hypothetical protein
VSVRPAGARGSRLRRALAAPLALWLLVALVLGGAHVADGLHARRDDGTLLHVGAWVAGLDHAACDHHAADSTFDRDSRRAEGADPCWLSHVATPGVLAAPAITPVRLPSPPGRVPRLAPRPLAPALVLVVAPKTSPPV